MAFHTLEMNLGLLSEAIYSGRPKLWNTWLKSSSAVVFRPEGDEVSLRGVYGLGSFLTSLGNFLKSIAIIGDQNRS